MPSGCGRWRNVCDRPRSRRGPPAPVGHPVRGSSGAPPLPGAAGTSPSPPSRDHRRRCMRPLTGACGYGSDQHFGMTEPICQPTPLILGRVGRSIVDMLPHLAGVAIEDIRAEGEASASSPRPFTAQAGAPATARTHSASMIVAVAGLPTSRSATGPPPTTAPPTARLSR